VGERDGVGTDGNITKLQHLSSGMAGTLQLSDVAVGADTLTLTNGANNYYLTLSTVTASAGPTFTNNMVAGMLTLGGLASTAATAQTAIFNGTSASAITSVGAITQGSGALSIVQSGSGTLLLTGGNSHSGGT